MSLTERINNDIKAAMLAKEKEKLEALRAIKSALLLLATEKPGTGNAEEAELKMLQKLVKQRKESAEIFNTQGRKDLAEPEIFQASVIERYLPAQLSEKEILELLKEIVSRAGASAPSDFGKVMGLATKELAGKADGKVISSLLKQILS